MNWLALKTLLVPMGLALVIVLPVIVVARPWSETSEWVGYLLLGTVFPSLGYALASRRLAKSRASAVIEGVLAAAALVGGLIFVATETPWAVWFLAASEILLVVWMQRRGRASAHSRTLRWMPISEPMNVWHGGLALVMTAILWQVAVRLEFWKPLVVVFWHNPGAWSVLLPTIAILVSVLTAPSERLKWPSSSARLRAGIWAGVAAILGWLSFRTADLISHVAYHHWGAYVGTAEAVRHGGVLLWDTPSQYGFLSVLVVACWPAVTTWEALYLAQGLATWIASGLIFGLLAAAFPGIRGSLVALLLTVVSVFAVPGLLAKGFGPSAYPSIGAFRFFWCYPLIGVLVWALRDDPIRDRNFLKVAIGGSVAWVAGVLWSPEMGAFATAIWIPAFAWLAGARGGGRSITKVRTATAWLLLPLTLLSIAVGVVFTWYHALYGHGPDLGTYADFIRSPYFALPMAAGGPVWVLVIVQAVTLGMLMLMWSNRANASATALALGNFGAGWAVASYFVGRSHANNVLNLAPFIAMSLGIVALQARRTPQLRAASFWLKAAYIPFASVLATLWLSPRPFARFLDSLVYRPTGHVETLFPSLDPSLVGALQKAGVGPEDRFVYISPDHELNPLPPAQGAAAVTPRLDRATWLPITAIIPLTPVARSKYIDRFASRIKGGGWLLLPKSLLTSRPNEGEAWLLERLKNSYVPGYRVSTDTWIVQWFDPTKSSSGIAILQF